MKNVGYVYKDY